MILPGIYASQISGHLFTATGNYTSIATATVDSSGASSITFSSIPQGYSHLQIRGFAKAGTDTNMFYQFNGDTGNNYSVHRLYGTGSGVSADSGIPYSSGNLGYNPSSTYFTGFVLDILDYTSAKNKVSRSLFGTDANEIGRAHV